MKPTRKPPVVEDLMLLSKAFSNPNAEAAQAAAESARTGKKKIARPAEASPKPRAKRGEGGHFRRERL